jgi:hypothetical protein
MVVGVLMKKRECVKADPSKRSAFRTNAFQSQDIICGYLLRMALRVGRAAYGWRHFRGGLGRNW